MLALIPLILTVSQQEWNVAFQWEGSTEYSFSGIDADYLGDIDGDGFPDFAIGTRAQEMEIVSSGTASLLHLLESPDRSDGMGWAILNTGDINGDGIDDYAISSPSKGYPSPPKSGLVVFYNGATGSILGKIYAQSASELFGFSLDTIPDIDGDGVVEILIGAPRADSDTGRAYLFSGANLSLLQTYYASGPDGSFGFSLQCADDFDGDGDIDVAIGSPFALNDRGIVQIFDATSGTPQAILYGNGVGEQFGHSIACPGDLNSDGLTDIVVGAPRASTGLVDSHGTVRAFSPAQNLQLWESTSVASGEWFGDSATTLGDINGDGIADCMFGAPHGRWASGTITGYARILSGLDGQSIRRHNGTKLRDYFGSTVISVGDFDADGLDDYAIGAFESDAKGSAIYDSGSLYVYSAASGNLLLQLDGNNISDRTAWSACSINDVNGDGYPEIIMGALYADTSMRDGQYGLEIRKHTGENSGDDFGRFVFAAGDIDADGYNDVAVGASAGDPNGLHGAGEVHFYNGNSGQIMAIVGGSVPGNYLGVSFAQLGDLDGDGYLDYAIGSPMASPNGLLNAGQMSIYSGFDQSIILHMDGEAKNDRLGNCLQNLGDLDGDGFPELAVGAYLDSQLLEKAGSVHILSLATGHRLAKLNGEGARDYFGYSIAKIGDVDGDGISDMAIGAKYADPNGMSEAGSVYVYSGSDFSLLQRLDGEAKESLFGSAVVGDVDFNGDGFSDIVIAAKYADVNGLTNAGKVYLFSGIDFSLLSVIEGTAPNNEFGFAMATGFDYNGDGNPDLLVTSPNANTASGQSSGLTELFTWHPPFRMITQLLKPGKFARLTALGSTPNQKVDFAWSVQGGGPTSTPLGIVDLTPPFNIVAGVLADGKGKANFTTYIPQSASGIRIWLQAFDRSSLTLCAGISRTIL